MKKRLLLLASAALLLTTNSFAECRKDTVNQFNVSNAGAKTSTARWISTFDSKNNQLTELYQFYSNSTFENSKLITKTYNANNRVLSSLEQTYDAGNSLWVNNKKYELTYAGSNVADSAAFTWDAGSSSWTEDVRLTYTYNGQGKILSSVFKELTVNKSKRELTYDANGNETKNEFFSWSSGAWVPLNKEERTYNASNKVLTLTNFSYNQGTMAYTNGQQFGYTYDVSNNETQREGRDWNGSTYTATIRFGTSWSGGKISGTSVAISQSTWTTVEQSFYAYDGSGNVTSIIKQTLQQVTPGNPPSLQNESRIEYAYNTANQQTRKSNQTYNKTTMQFSTNYEEVNNYNASGKLTRFATFSFVTNFGLLPVNETLYEFNANEDLVAIETKTGFNTNQGGFTSVTREEYICGVNQVSGIASVSDIQFSVYPNPANENVNISLNENVAKVVITDMMGKVVFEQKEVADKVTVTTRDFAAGLYFVSLESKGQKAVKRLVISKQ